MQSGSAFFLAPNLRRTLHKKPNNLLSCKFSDMLSHSLDVVSAVTCIGSSLGVVSTFSPEPCTRGKRGGGTKPHYYSNGTITCHDL